VTAIREGASQPGYDGVHDTNRVCARPPTRPAGRVRLRGLIEPGARR
jgi:hypothetical protein